MALTLEEKFERVRDLRPIDDVFFEVLASDPRVCEEILRTILKDPGLVVDKVAVQDSNRNLYGHSVRLDALCVLGSGKHVNIEVQRADNDDHLRRARFNASLITMTHSEPGGNYRNIPDVIIVYITEFDFLKQGKTVCHIRKVIEETGAFVDDGLSEVFLNTVIDDGTDIS